VGFIQLDFTARKESRSHSAVRIVGKEVHNLKRYRAQTNCIVTVGRDHEICLYICMWVFLLRPI
jgi:hypothetical protein